MQAAEAESTNEVVLQAALDLAGLVAAVGSEPGLGVAAAPSHRGRPHAGTGGPAPWYGSAPQTSRRFRRWARDGQ